MKNLYDIQQLSEILGIAPSTIRSNRVRRPGACPPAVKVFGQLRWDPDVVEDWLKKRQEPTPA